MLDYFVGLIILSAATGFLTNSPAWGFFTLGCGILLVAIITSLVKYLK